MRKCCRDFGPRLSALKERLGLAWADDSLLHLALTHSSYPYENRSSGGDDNQRLEFLGDAVLGLLISEYLYRTYPRYTEGELTKLRAAVVCEPSLASVAGQLGLGECLNMGRGEERSGGRRRPSILADCLEAVLGAVYLTGGAAEAKRIVTGYFVPMIDQVVQGHREQDYKTLLQEKLQQNSTAPLSYTIIKEEGPDHNKVFTAAVVYRGRVLGSGAGHSKKLAEQQAARSALAQLQTGDEGLS
ncbi:MAG: ribonuclease III [Peptococcaceae bacterium]|jgi:ribonuclease-3|nr:ribonuclease III [Peptococcaceae bacterium]